MLWWRWRWTRGVFGWEEIGKKKLQVRTKRKKMHAECTEKREKCFCQRLTKKKIIVLVSFIHSLPLKNRWTVPKIPLYCVFLSRSVVGRLFAEQTVTTSDVSCVYWPGNPQICITFFICNNSIFHSHLRFYLRHQLFYLHSPCFICIPLFYSLH